MKFQNHFFSQNGTWYHLSVHAAPKFVITPKDVVYVGIGDNIILPCQVGFHHHQHHRHHPGHTLTKQDVLDVVLLYPIYSVLVQL